MCSVFHHYVWLRLTVCGACFSAWLLSSFRLQGALVCFCAVKDPKLSVMSPWKCIAYTSGSQAMLLAGLVTLLVLWERIHSLISPAHICLLSLLRSFSIGPFSSSKPATMARASSPNLTPSLLAPTLTGKDLWDFTMSSGVIWNNLCFQRSANQQPSLPCTLNPHLAIAFTHFPPPETGKGHGGGGSRSLLCLS